MKKNFTLLEGFVVLCILAILAGMLIPAISKARKKTQEINQKNKINIGLIAEALYKIDIEGDVYYCDDYEASNSRIRMFGKNRQFNGEVIMPTAKKISIMINPDKKKSDF